MTRNEKHDELRRSRAYDTRESNDRTERRSCGDPGELAAQERWLRRMGHA